MKRLLFPLGLLLAAPYLWGQTIERIQLPSSEDNPAYYLALRPRETAQGILILLPGFGQDAESVFPDTRFANLAYVNQLVLVSLPNNFKLHLDKNLKNLMDRLIRDAIQRYRVPSDKVVLGGFSAGGLIALRYVERCLEAPVKCPCVPAAVFAADAPVDLAALWQASTNEIHRNFSPEGMAEARFILDYLETELEGSPQTNPEAYVQESPFTTGLGETGHERFLSQLPIRLYYDLDATWYLQNRRRPLADLNATPGSLLISQLQLLGNTRAEWVQPNTPSRRNDGIRTPHSWSVVDEYECIQWIHSILD